MNQIKISVILLATLVLASCKKEEEEEIVITPVETALNPATAPVQAVDRFSSDAGTLMIRDGSNGLPATNSPINFDQAPFITHGFGPAGEHTAYYNFDVMPIDPAPIYVLFRSGSDSPVEGQLNIVDVIPGSTSYNDFWNVVKVTVPSNYLANTVSSVAQIISKGYATEETTTIVNCPIVPMGSTASMRLGSTDTGLVLAWYNSKVVYYFNFSEAPLMGLNVPTSPIYVTFNINPNMPNGGPPSGFMTEDGTQTHNVLGSLPGDIGYSPLWSVSVFDNADFATVNSLSTAQSSNVLANGVMNVNCPVVLVE